MTMTAEASLRRWQAAVKRVTSEYRANRADLEPLVRLVVDVLALAALVHRSRPMPVKTSAVKEACE